MRIETFEQSCRIDASAEVVFKWHASPGALERLIPPWERVTVEEPSEDIRDGSRVVLQVSIGPLRRRWIAVHRNFIEGRQFRDEQVKGPFAHWIHTHSFQPDGPNTCALAEKVEYALPCGTVGTWFGRGIVRRKLHRMFTYRHAVTQADILAHLTAGGGKGMHIAVSGSGGLLGSTLAPFLTTGGHRVTRLVRRSAGEGNVLWDLTEGVKDPRRLEGVDAVVHLAGENIAGGRWTPERKDEIRRSRIEGTRRLCESLAGLNRRPKVLLTASAVGYYGSRGDEILSETSGPGSDFLARVCQKWEAATEPASRTGIRVVHLRFGMILSPAGGVLKKMLLPFKLGVGGRIGHGRQYVSWIAIDDAIGAIHHAICTKEVRGPVNVVSPNPVTNAEFTRVLGQVLSRPAILPLPSLGARLAFGELADALLLASQRATPERLQSAGYRFRFPDLEGALRHLLGRH